MKNLFVIVSIASLVVVALAAVAFASGQLSDAATKNTLLMASIVWFVTTPFWMKGKDK